MLELLLINQTLLAQVKDCPALDCKPVKTVVECREEYTKVESYPILGTNVTDTYLVTTCYTFELDSNNKKTGRAKKTISKVRV